MGYDIESKVPETGKLRFLEVKGRLEDAETVTVTKNEVLTALNKPEEFILALVQVPKTEESLECCFIRYVKQPFQREPDFSASSVNYHWKKLWQQGQEPNERTD